MKIKIPGALKTYAHSLLGVAIAMIVIFFTLNWLRTKGPAIVRGPATTAGNLVGGSAFQF